MRACCAPTRSPPAWTPHSPCSTKPARARCATSRGTRRSGAWLDGEHGAAALDIVAAYDTDRLRRMIATTHDALRSAGQTAPRLPQPPPAGDPAPLRAALAQAAADAAAELARAGSGKRVGEALAKAERCAELLRVHDGDPCAAVLGELSFGASANALRTAACARYLGALEAYARTARGPRAVAAVARARRAARRLRVRVRRRQARACGAGLRRPRAFARDLLDAEPALRRSYAERFDRVMVDEFQDSNPRQLALFEALDRDDLFVVGDEQQSIYGFRHADVDVFRARRAALAARGRVATLATNFRSRGQILDTINAASRRGWDRTSSRCARAASRRRTRRGRRSSSCC